MRARISDSRGLSGGGRSAERSLISSTTDPASEGGSTLSPRAAASTASTISIGVDSFDRKPVAPASSASYTVGPSVNADRSRTRVGSFSRVTARATAMPSSSGIRWSSSATSGPCSRIAASASRPLPA
jgi:hypothetical protein